MNDGPAPTPQDRSGPTETDTGQLAHLMQYTIFHIRTYIALAVGALAVRTEGHRELLIVPIVLFLVAGLSGSVVGSNIPRFATYAAFKEARIGVGGREHLLPARWMAVEHLSFWAGLLTGLAIFLGG